MPAFKIRLTQQPSMVNHSFLAMFSPCHNPRSGFESSIGTNHFGPFLLINLLLPILEKSAPSRVVSLSGDLCELSPVNSNSAFARSHAQTKDFLE